jgi:putative phosphoesterase
VRVAVISDTHLPRGARALPARCLAELRAAELVLHAGDVVGAAVLAELRELAPVEAVHGNMDDAELRAALPARRVVEAAGVRIGMVHDAGPLAGRETRLIDAFPRCEAVVYGHTHVPQVACRDGVWILNPGSPTERRRAPSRSCIVLEIAEGTIEPRLVELPSG